jgi:hypothetical protein
MKLFNGLTLEDLDGKIVIVIERGKHDDVSVDVTKCRALLNSGQLSIDCIPNPPGKFVVAVPDDATIHSTVRENVAMFLIMMTQIRSPQDSSAQSPAFGPR